MLRLESPEQGRIRSLLAADHAYQRAQWLRQLGVTALAAAGCAAWIGRSAGGEAMQRLALAGWLALLVFTVGAAIAEITAWRRLHRAIQDTRR